MPLKELPKDSFGGNRRCGGSEVGSQGNSAGPGVAAAPNGVEDDFAPLLAGAPAPFLNPKGVLWLRNHRLGRIPRAAIRLDPALHGEFDRPKFRLDKTLWATTSAIGGKFVSGPVKMQNRNGPHWPAVSIVIGPETDAIAAIRSESSDARR